MIPSKIELRNGRPELLIGGSVVPAAAYTTYFEERSRYEDFIGAGYRIFFVNVSMTDLPINSVSTGFTPFRVGVFEDPDREDYSEFENAVRRILRASSDAFIFPRIYVSMPRHWIEAHPEETIPTPKGGYRESMASEAFRTDGAELLVRMVRHILSSDYADRIAGWQLCGGNTQEWFHHDCYGGIAPAMAEPYRRYAKQVYGIDGAVLPDPAVYRGEGRKLCEDENARCYAEFSSVCIAETLEHFARTVKEETGYRQVVGAFYGYAYEASSSLVGSLALRCLLDSPALDFFSSPNCYTKERAFGIDWSDMMPVDSLKHHGKLAFIECDIRTYLTTGMQEARPGVYPADIYPMTKNGEPSVWAGPPTSELSREALRKCFAHQVARASGIWWFDMWGGWYQDPILMEAIRDMKRILEETIGRSGELFPSETVFFADERAYANLSTERPFCRAVVPIRVAMGNTGAPYDSCMVEDAAAILERYRAAVFPSPVPSAAGRRAMALCEKKEIPYLTATAEHPILTEAEITEFLASAGVHLYCDGGDVIYVGNGYVGLHAREGGEKRIRLPKACRITSVYGAKFTEAVGDEIFFLLARHATALFRVAEI